MFPRIVFAALALLAAPLAFSLPLVGSGTPVTQTREVSGFHGLRLAIPARVEVVQGEREGITLTADDNVAGEVETTVEDGVLHIRWRSRDLQARLKTELRVTLQARMLDSIAILGSGDVRAPALTASRMAVNISGSGDVSLGGKAQSLEVRISGSGDLRAGKFEAENVSVRIAGSGDAIVWARRALDASVAGSGDVRYYGDPAIKRHIAGSGSVRKSGDAPG
ncbi:MAG TPA: head GIN domain-containing protein [Usitatibacter sp.]|nr:head GIN domain-containing protein [Usitatibacter sp.]